MARVTFKNVSKYFDTTRVVDNLNFEIHDKEFVVIVGPSGCGKSTTLRMVAGLESISEGEIFIGDRLINDVSPKDRDIAMVFQNYALYPHMDVYRNMAFGLKLRKIPAQEIDRRVLNAANILGIENLLTRKPKQLSGGQRQRVAVGRAIVREPSVFLFDEPLSNLDAKLRVQMRTEIKKLHERLRTTMMYVTHDQVEAMTMGDRIVILKDGVLQQAGTPMEVYRYPRNVFVAGFIGSPSMNLLKAKVKDGRIFLGSAPILTNEMIESLFDLNGVSECIIGVRPEDFIVVGRDAGQEGNNLSFTVSIDLVETTGAESMVHSKLEDHPIIVRLTSDSEIPEDKKMNLAINLKKIHVFNGETEMTLRRNA
ncbi:MAG: sn-glycerol-3-phosphate ABC transporter ATP-binding protein UgpC [bacterium]